MATFEEQLAALEGIVEKMERGDFSLDESLKLFEEGMALSSACKKQLDAADGRIQVLLQRENLGDKGVVARDLVIETDDAEDGDED